MGLLIDLSYTTLGIITLLVMALIGALYYFFSYWQDIRSGFPELSVHQAARKRPHPPIIDVMDASGGHRQFLGDKKKPQSASFKNEENGLIFDPRQHSTVPSDHLADGTKVFTYCTTYHFPVDNFGALAVGQALAKIRTQYPALSFIRDDFVIMELLEKSSTDLPHDIGIILNSYKQDGEGIILGNDDLCCIIEDIKTEIKTWGMEPGFYSLSDAISKLPFGLTASDVQRIINLAKMEAMNDTKQQDYDKWFPVMVICGFAMMIIIAYMVLK